MELSISTKELTEDRGNWIAFINFSKYDGNKIGAPGAVKYGESKEEAYAKLKQFLEQRGHIVKTEVLPKSGVHVDFGVKYSQNKAPMGMMLKQFPLALEAVAFRSKVGHEGKYSEFDADWMNFKREPNSVDGYKDASVRHLAEIGDDEDKLGHLKAAAWNILAALQLTLEKEKND